MDSNTSATRMELLRLRRRLGLARRGHHLLKGKNDELLRRFLVLMEKYLRLRRDLHQQVIALAARTREVRTEVSTDTVRTAAWPPPAAAKILVHSSNILNLPVPRYEYKVPEKRSSYVSTQLPSGYDGLASQWRSTAPLLAEVGEKERVLLLLASEIEKTRRRVNALEHKLIPGLEEHIRAITLKMAENELGNLARLLRIKDIVRGHESVGP